MAADVRTATVEVEGHTLHHHLLDLPPHALFRGRRRWDGAAVLVKVSILPLPSPEGIARLGRELAFLDHQDPRDDGLPRAYGLVESSHGPALVLEDPSGDPVASLIASGPISPHDFLPCAMALATVLRDFHASGALHGSLTPDAFLYDRRRHRAKLITFSNARQGVSLPPPTMPGEESVTYGAPEQTGRINRRVDRRSDLYALGGVFYTLLTGQPPFAADDPLEVIHAHLGRVPPPPSRLNPLVPEVLDAMVLKLLSKAAEERYQSAAGVLADLQTCAKAVEASGQFPPPLPLGRQDQAGGLVFPQGLIGRNKEVEALRAALERGNGLLLISGPSGIGKTSLIREALQPTAQTGRTVLFGAFQEFRRTTPYAAIIEALSHHVRLLLSRDSAGLAALRQRLIETLGDGCSVLADVIPDLRRVIGACPQAQDLPPADAEQRFNRLMRSFLAVIVPEDAPLTLVLEDLQWADLASLSLLQNLLHPSAQTRLTVVGSLRESGSNPSGGPVAFLVDRLRAAGVPVIEIRPTPLGLDEVTELLSTVLTAPPEQMAELARLCRDKTRGNPYFLTRFLENLFAEQYLRPHPGGGWDWDSHAIATRDYTENVVSLLVERVRGLSAVSRRVLQRAACIGPRFDLWTLSRINDVGPSESLEQLRESTEAGLVELEETGERPRDGGRAVPWFRFTHERVYQALYSQMNEGERALRHLFVGRALLESVPDIALSDRLFETVEHLNRGLPQVRDEALRRRIAALNLEAARRANAAAAGSAALAYADHGLSCLSPQASPQDSLPLLWERMVAAFGCKDFTVLEETGHDALALETRPLDRARLFHLLVLGRLVEGDFAGSTRALRNGLDVLGYRLPVWGGELRLLMDTLRLGYRCQRRMERGLPSYKPSTRAEDEMALRLVLDGQAALDCLNPNLFPSAILLILHLAERTGERAALLFALGTGAVMLGVIGRTQAALRLGRWVARMLAEEPPTFPAHRTHMVLAYGLAFRSERPQALVERLDRSAALAEQFGDMDYHSEIVLLRGITRLLWSGGSLDQVENDARWAYDTALQGGNTYTEPVAAALLQAVEALRRPTTDPAVLSGRWFDDYTRTPEIAEAGNLFNFVHVLILRLFVAVIFDRRDLIPSALQVLQTSAHGAKGLVLEPVIAFLVGIVAARHARLGHMPPVLLRRMVRQFRRWHRQGLPLAHHRWLFLLAEQARLNGRDAAASDLYDAALDALAGEHLHHEEALINEAAAAFHDRRGRTRFARVYRRQAYYHYRLWGADTKVQDLEAQWPDIVRSREKRGAGLDLGATGSLDMMAVMRTAQAISGEIQRPALIETLLRITMGAAGAQRGLLLLYDSESGWTIEAEGEAPHQRYTLLRVPVSPDRAETEGNAERGAAPSFCHAVLRYALHTMAPVVLDDASRSGAFVTDPYIRRQGVRSLLCLPLLRGGSVRGMLYLENNLMALAFTQDRLEMLRLLAAQVVISLDNARLYEDLTRLNRTLEGQVSERTREALEKSRLLEATLQNMSEGLVALDAQGRTLLRNARAAGLLAADLSVRGTVSLDQEADVPLSDGRTIQVRRSGLPEGGEVRLLLDVTEDRRRTAELDQARRAAEQALKDLKATQESLLQAEKMSSLGQLVAGVAHEINTPIGVALTAASFLSEQAASLDQALSGPGLRRSELQKFLEQVRETTSLMLNNIGRAADLVQSFKKVAVDQTSDEHRPFTLRDTVDDVVRSFSPMLRKTPHRITVAETALNTQMVSYPGAISQILSNLVVNALVHAFRDEDRPGTIHIDLTEPSDQEAALIVRDDGCGMDAALQEKIFDPFFTTSRQAGGSGLGLHIVYNLVTGRLKGTITVDSTPGHGTTFHLRFPRTVPNPSPRKEGGSPGLS